MIFFFFIPTAAILSHNLIYYSVSTEKFEYLSIIITGTAVSFFSSVRVSFV